MSFLSRVEAIISDPALERNDMANVDFLRGVLVPPTGRSGDL
jgi:hypothetical protein